MWFSCFNWNVKPTMLLVFLSWDGDYDYVMSMKCIVAILAFSGSDVILALYVEILKYPYAHNRIYPQSKVVKHFS